MLATAQPLSTPPTTLAAGGAGVGEEHLVELVAAGDVDDRPDLDARLVHRAQQERDAGVLGAASGSVRQSTKIQLAGARRSVQIFWPLITHSSPSSVARVPSEARSEPEFGSE